MDYLAKCFIVADVGRFCSLFGSTINMELPLEIFIFWNSFIYIFASRDDLSWYILCEHWIGTTHPIDRINMTLGSWESWVFLELSHFLSLADLSLVGRGLLRYPAVIMDVFHVCFILINFCFIYFVVLLLVQTCL